MTVTGTVPSNSPVVAPADVTLTITDDDTRGVTVTPTALSVNEGASADYTVVLTSQPTAAVTVTLTAPANPDVTVNKHSADLPAREVEHGADGDGRGGGGHRGGGRGGDYHPYGQRRGLRWGDGRRCPGAGRRRRGRVRRGRADREPGDWWRRGRGGPP